MGLKCPIRLFLGGWYGPLILLFFLGWKPSLKNRGQKRGILLFYTDGPRSPFFKAILQKIEGSPFFSFFLWIASSGYIMDISIKCSDYHRFVVTGDSVWSLESCGVMILESVGSHHDLDSWTRSLGHIVFLFVPLFPIRPKKGT